MEEGTNDLNNKRLKHASEMINEEFKYSVIAEETNGGNNLIVNLGIFSMALIIYRIF